MRMMESGKVDITFDIEAISKTPAFTFILFYLAGILTGSRYFIQSTILVKIIVPLVVLVFLIISIGFKKRNIITEFLLPVLLYLSMFIAGWINIEYSNLLNNSANFSKVANIEVLNAQCKITGKILEKERSYQTEARLIEYDEKIILYIDKNVDRKSFDIGDTLECIIRPNRINNYLNSTFDYARFMEKQGFFTTSYVKAGQVAIRKASKLSLKEKIIKIRENYIDYLLKNKHFFHEKAVLIALTIGDKSFIDGNTKKAFSNSGTMHLMAVSGLHVSFIYSLISSVLKFMGMSRFAKIIRFIIVSLTVWTYTALVGFTPSIMRAALMATIYELSSIIERECSSLNTLSISAFIITIVQPESLFELGFQLSFTSLLAIIFIHPMIVKLNPSKNIIVKYLWNTISMSLACQIGTSIITIYNFRFVPTYFLITNLIAIPISGLILYLAAVHLFALWIGLFHEQIMNIIIYLTKILLYTVNRIESLPLAIINCRVNSGQAVILSALLFISVLGIPKDKNMRRLSIKALIITFIISLLK